MTPAACERRYEMFKQILTFLGAGDKIESEVTLSNLQGKWRLVASFRNGEPMPVTMVYNARVFMVVKGAHYSLEQHGRKGDRGALRVNQSVEPVHCDQQIMSGADAGQVRRGIVRFRNGELEYCLGEAGKARPTGFSEARTDGASINLYRRVE